MRNWKENEIFSKIKKIQNPWLVCLPFLFLFIYLVFRYHTNEMEGDEGRYFMFAQNLLQGFYSPIDEVNLWNGPGYPIILMPFVALNLPLITIPLLNAFLQYFSLILLFKVIMRYITDLKVALSCVLFWGFFYISYEEIPQILTEPLTSFLCILFLFLIQKYMEDSAKIKYSFLAGLTLGYLVLTKVIFGYVLIIIAIGTLLTFIYYYVFRNRINYKLKKLCLVMFCSILVVTPYLIYTYSLTGRFPYFANSGGMSLYWMSTPYDNEYGDWNNETFTALCRTTPCNADKFAANHKDEMDIITKYKGVEKDDAYKKIAIINIKKKPLKYLRNCVSNVSRLLFGFPYSYYYQKDGTIFKILPNAFLVVFSFFALILWLLNFQKYPIELNFYILVIFTYLGLSVLVSAYQRQFYVIVPIILVWISRVYYRKIRINFRGDL